MESRNVWINQPDSNQRPDSSVHCYFTDQGLRAGYTGQELGRTQYGQFGHYDLHPPPPLPSSLSHDMRDTIQREIEKERIREQIIMSEITKRRALEAEIRRELMILEEELARHRESNALLLGLPPVSDPVERSVAGTIAQGRSLDERVAFSPEKKETLNVVRCESRGFETLPFQRGAGDLKDSEVMPVPVTEKGKEEEKIVLLVKPEANISGSKRKAVTPPIADTCKRPSDIISNKKAKGEWSCALCQVIATSEAALNGHLQGKKHKMKEASLKTDRAGKNFSVGLLIDTPSASKEIAADSPLLKKDEESSSKRNVDLLLLLENHISDNLKKKQVETIQKVQKNGDSKKAFWCEICKVGTSSEKVMNDHEKGKKHVKRLLKELAQKRGTEVDNVGNNVELALDTEEN